MSRITIVPLILAILTASGVRGQEAATPPPVLAISLEDRVVDPVMVRFVEGALERAYALKAQCLIIRLDTPGGLLESCRQIVKDILKADVPVVVYVAPRGARAASAGVFITLASHVAVMAPGTHIGAAHPVSVANESPLPGGSQKNSANPMSEKILNDTVAWVRSVAEYRGRNADWATRAVKESISTPADQALKEHVIDFLADDEAQLLAKLDGRTIFLPGRTVTLHTHGAEVVHASMSWSERLLDFLVDPTLAYVLFLLGFVGLVFEMTHPGVWVPGIAGLVCLVLAFVAFQMLPINYAGVALVGLGFLLLLLEVKVHTLGIMAGVGLGCLLLGSSMLVKPVPGLGGVSWLATAPVSLAVGLIVLLLVGNVVRSHRAKPRTGMQSLIGEMGTVKEDGFILVHGELWRMRSDEPMQVGEAAQVHGFEGLTLLTRREVQTEDRPQSQALKTTTPSG